MIRSMGGFRRVNFGRNDSKLILKNPELRRRLREAEARIQAGFGVRGSVDELRSRLGIEP